MEGNNSMTARSWLSAGWETFRKYRARLVMAGLLWFAWTMVTQVVSAPGQKGYSSVFANSVLIVGWLFLLILSVGWCSFCLKLARGQDVRFVTIFEGFRRWLTALGTGIAYTIIVVVGCILLVVPGIIWYLKYSLAFYAIMDKQLGAWKALKLSGSITTGHKGQLFYAGLVYFVPTLSVSVMAFVYLYDDFFQSDFWIYFLVPYHLLWSCVLFPWITCSFAVAYDRLSKVEGWTGDLAKEELPKT